MSLSTEICAPLAVLGHDVQVPLATGEKVGYAALDYAASAPALQRVWDDMVARDERDSARSVAPLKPADDAFVLDTSSMNADEAFAQAKAFIVSKKKT